MGVGVDGLTPVPNAVGIYINDDAPNCTIGAPGMGSRTVVSGNHDTGIRILGNHARVLNTFVMAQDPNIRRGSFV